jgi:cell division inhibitor SepF
MATMFRKAMLYLGLGPDDEYEDDLGVDDGYSAANPGPQRPATRPVPPADSSVRAQRPQQRPASPAARPAPPAGAGRPARSPERPREPELRVPPSRPADEPSRPMPRPVAQRPRGRAPSAPPDNEPSAVRPIASDKGAKPNPVVRQVPAPAKPFVVSPEHFNEAQDVGDRFRSSQPVILNLQGVDRELSRRLIDFSSGLCYALGGHMEKVANSVYLLSPQDVEVGADERRRLHERGLHDA